MRTNGRRFSVYVNENALRAWLNSAKTARGQAARPPSTSHSTEESIPAVANAKDDKRG